MELTADTVDALADEYADAHPFATVEDEHREIMPATLESGDYGWRDVEWVVQWYYRRRLDYDNAARRRREAAFGDNEYEAVHAAIDDALAADETEAKLEALTTLSGVDPSVATAFLQFLDPGRYLVLSDREWGVLQDCGELEEPYPEEPSPAAYERYLETCQDVADRCECDLQTLYRALWQVETSE
ncbi:hypothetical protein [Natronobacterium gregoryi]|uniref:Uncharacterized protein n=2 Tax=Natronobacterium gregoryi TaxID=44930 RepID=L0ALJ1_NATGS|nr:hypothetical protein [Natronobacterium gregoryi]AFZ74057.1 hypothetical protein Natgr_2919 [Natronobacterium gregoryi SP2]ELY70359.1 hypothetical protein C490_06624 [Natronobacterium gregoryi SP2]PLK20800.1 hypothetical protein CYV19_07780 [Natronobacterium gregoryi SP2]SFJ06609.1 hypothetical protein SAMN05443661_11323 [Natronobacterium gregoryi]